jgi:hypothetical protein
VWQNKGIVVGSSDCDVYNNVVKAVGTLNGSGLAYDASRSAKIYNNVFIWSGNSGETNGYKEPAIYLRDSGGAYAPTSSHRLDIINNTIITPEGAGIDSNCIVAPVQFTNNLIAQPGTAGVYVVNSNGGTLTQTGNYQSSTVSGVGFVNAAGGNYALSPTSPAIDTGVSATSFGVTTDIDGRTRPLGAAYDPGAYEASVYQMLVPLATGTATGSQFCPANGAFNAPPSFNASTQTPSGDEADATASTGTSYANRHFYIDLGTDWAKWRITATWTRYRTFSGGTYSGFPSMWWDSNTDTVNGGTSETRLNFNVGTVTHISAQQWVKDKDYSAVPIVPQGRYLVVFAGAAPSNRPNEFLFVGYKVP